jgi:HEPN domain-containing protein
MMRDPRASIREIEKHLTFLKKTADQHSTALNVPQFETLAKQDYKSRVANIDYWHFIQHADQHYFVARILFMHHVVEYSFFCAQQCVENYLKAYLKYHTTIPPDTHDLQTLLDQCRKLSHTLELFITSTHIEIIVQLFNPFNELARYPIQRKRPKDGQYVVTHPTDIFNLDYFVFRMREILSIPTNTWDILRDGLQQLYTCQEEYPEFYALFKADNVNFTRNLQ